MSKYTLEFAFQLVRLYEAERGTRCDEALVLWWDGEVSLWSLPAMYVPRMRKSICMPRQRERPRPQMSTAPLPDRAGVKKRKVSDQCVGSLCRDNEAPRHTPVRRSQCSRSRSPIASVRAPFIASFLGAVRRQGKQVSTRQHGGQ